MPRPILKAMLGLSVLAYKLLGKRMRVANRPVLLLTTVGAKTGKRRQSVVCWFPDGAGTTDSCLVVGSAGGSARHPAWCYNLAKNPDQAWIEVERKERPVRAESLEGPEREEAWQRITAMSTRFASYGEKTDRIIPVVRLVGADG